MIRALLEARTLRDAARRVRRAEVVRRWRSRANLVAVRRLRRTGGSDVVFDLCTPVGMGAMFTHMLNLLAISRDLGLRPHFRATNPCYGSRSGAADWLPDILIQKHPPVAGAPVLPVRDEWGYLILSGRAPRFTIAEGHRLFFDHFALAPAVHEEADRALAGAPPGPMLGVHYRGTDKYLEAPPLDEARLMDAIAERLAGGRYAALVLATDEPRFERDVRARFAGTPVFGYAGAAIERRDGVPIHFSGGDGYAKGLDALVNIVLLSRCATVLRSTSYLSGWAKVLAPEQESIIFNRVTGGGYHFPDTQAEIERGAN